MPVCFEPIGVIHTPFRTREGMPIQPGGAQGIQGHIVLKEAFAAGLKDLQGFSHIILIYYFHQSSGYDLLTTPFLDQQPRGVFATRAPKRPNAIGLSVVRLLKVANHIVYVENVDMLDETPLLDIKPYVPDFDVHRAEKTGWIRQKSTKLKDTKSDNRFG